jgi:CRP-like cAMP-binding protein
MKRMRTVCTLILFVVFKQGDDGSEWFIILSGQVHVFLSKTGVQEDSFKISTMNVGQGFGELALEKDVPRR